MAGRQVPPDERDDRRREKMLELTLQELAVGLANDEGLRRLRAIADEEWQAAVELDGGE